jgi:hypothetical protein
LQQKQQGNAEENDMDSESKAALVIRAAVKWLAPIVLASGSVVGVYLKSQYEMDRMKDNHAALSARLEVLRGEFNVFRAWDASGFRDPGLFTAISVQVDRQVQMVMTAHKKEIDRWKRALKQLNPTIVLPAEADF